MAYNETYTGDDVGKIVLDGLGKILVAIGTLASVLGLVFAYRWLTKRK
jgi:hypothetical protein